MTTNFNWCLPEWCLSEMFITAKWSTISFMMISYMIRLGFMVTPVLGLFKGGERVLPLKSYIPYSVSNLLSYLAKYLQQFLALFYAIILNVTFEIFPLRNICGICVHFYLRWVNSETNIFMAYGKVYTIKLISILQGILHNLLANLLLLLLFLKYLY